MRSLNRKARPIACNPWIAVRSLFVFEHDLFGKPVPTFPDHAVYRRCGGDVAGGLRDRGFLKVDANMFDDWLRPLRATPRRAAMAGSGRRRSRPRPRAPSSA